MRARLPVCFILSMAISAACGGRSRPGDDDEGQTSGGSSTSGRSGHAGTKAGSGGKVGVAGSSTQGGVSLGGFATAGTAGSPCICPDIACPPGTQPVSVPDSCCYECEPIGCVALPCPQIACASGHHLEALPGQCCPTCVADDCNAQVDTYLEFREQLLEKYSAIPCMSDADCSYFYDKNPCQAGCGFPIATSIISSLDMNLQSFAAQTCSPGCLHPTPPCDPSAAAYCIDNRCQ